MKHEVMEDLGQVFDSNDEATAQEKLACVGPQVSIIGAEAHGIGERFASGQGDDHARRHTVTSTDVAAHFDRRGTNLLILIRRGQGRAAECRSRSTRAGSPLTSRHSRSDFAKTHGAIGVNMRVGFLVGLFLAATLSGARVRGPKTSGSYLAIHDVPKLPASPASCRLAQQLTSQTETLKCDLHRLAPRAED